MTWCMINLTQSGVTWGEYGYRTGLMEGRFGLRLRFLRSSDESHSGNNSRQATGQDDPPPKVTYDPSNTLDNLYH